MRQLLLQYDLSHGHSNLVPDDVAEKMLQSYPWKPQVLPSGGKEN